MNKIKKCIPCPYFVHKIQQQQIIIENLKRQNDNVQEIERLAVLSELESLLKHSSKKFQSDEVVDVSVIKDKIKELTRV